MESKLSDKQIAEKIISTQSAYTMIEYNNKVYLSYYGFSDNNYYEFNEEGKPVKKITPEEALLSFVMCPEQSYDEQGNNEIFTEYNSYKELVSAQERSVLCDMEDMGLTQNKEWNFYLSKEELIYIGVDAEVIEKQLAQELDLPFKKQAENLPKGWQWISYNDGSGHLQSPEGQEYFSYDWTTGEYKITPDKFYDFFMVENYESGGYSIGSFAKFKEYAEEYINKNVLNEKEKNNMKIYCVSYEKNDVNQAIIVNANNEKEANDYVASYRNCDKVWGASELQQSLYESYKKRGMPEITVPETFNKSEEENEINNNEEELEEPDICDEE